LALSAAAQQKTDSPVIVRPGAPGQPTKQLDASTRASLPQISRTDVGFMQGMIHHHAQAVEMSALIEGRTQNKELKLLGAKIAHVQSDEIQFMRRWLAVRGEATEMKMDMPAAGSGDDHSHHGHGGQSGHTMLMPGMLTPAQMKALAAAKGAEFDKLFLEGMIQHHQGALTMVKELFDASGSGQDAELFNFASDVDSGQRAEIKIMQNMLARVRVK
jgi:uncharacterized protein (DUF305 family)